MLGSRCCCGAEGCVCPNGKLPDFVTVKIEGVSGAKQQSGNLLPISFSSCFGSGAAGYATTGQGDVPAPLSGITLTNKGDGYAKKPRIEPTLSIESSSKGGAVFSVASTKSQDSCKVDYWKVSSVSIVNSGSGFSEGEFLPITIEAPGTCEVPAAITVKVRNDPPTLTATANSECEDVEFTVSLLASPYGDPDWWGVNSISVQGDTADCGFEDYQSVVISYEPPTSGGGAAANIRTTHNEPTPVFSVIGGDGNAKISGTMYPFVIGADMPMWYVYSLSIDDGGTGYEVGDAVTISASAGTHLKGSGFSAAVETIDPDGVILSILIESVGQYFDDNGGEIDHIDIESRGEYAVVGVADTVTVKNGGKYYEESDSGTPYVAEVTAEVVSTYPSAGNGAVLSVVVEDEIGEDFGKIKSVSIDENGVDYKEWFWVTTCYIPWDYNADPEGDHTVVCWREGFPSDPENSRCVWASGRCYGGNVGLVRVRATCECLNKSEVVPATVSTDSEGNSIPGEDPGGTITAITAIDPEWVINNPQARGWAVYGREPPGDVTTINGDDSAAVECVVEEKDDACLPFWEITSVTIKSGGCGHFVGQTVQMAPAEGTVERAAEAIVTAVTNSPPSLTVDTDGRSTEFTVSLSELNTTPQTWGVSGISISGDVSQWVDKEPLTIKAEGCTSVLAPAIAVVRTARLEPEVTASPEPPPSLGSGANISVTLELFDEGRWRIKSLQVLSGGAGYAKNNVVTFTSDDAEEITPARGRVFSTGPGGMITGVRILNRGDYSAEEEPTITAVILDRGGAELSLTLQEFTTEENRDAWRVLSVAVDSPGASYAVRDQIKFTVPADPPAGQTGSTHEIRKALAIVSKVDNDGGIAGVTVRDGGEYWGQSGDAEIVEVITPGVYAVVGVISGLELTHGGVFYNQSPELEPLLPPIDVEIEQKVLSNGTGAEVNAIVNLDTASESFGTLEGFEVVSGGSGYLLENAWNTAGVVVEYRGPSLPPVVSFSAVPKFVEDMGGFGVCELTLETETLISDCDDFSFVASLGDGTATVTPGGSPTPVFKGSKMACGRCDSCCKEHPSQVTIHFFREETSGQKFLFDAVEEHCNAVDNEVIVDFDPDAPCVWSMDYSAGGGYSETRPPGFPMDHQWIAPPLSNGTLVLAMNGLLVGPNYGITSSVECHRTLEIRYSETASFLTGLGQIYEPDGSIAFSYTRNVVLSKPLGEDFLADNCDPSTWTKTVTDSGVDEWVAGSEFNWMPGSDSPYSVARVVCPPVEITITVQ